MTRRASAVALGEDCGSTDGQDPLAGKKFGDCIFDHQFRTIHFHWGQELAIWKLRKSFGLTRDADEIFHIVIPGSDVLVANRPIDGDALAQIRFEIEITPAIRLSSPDNRAATHLTSPNPQKWLAGFCGVRILLVVDEEFAVPLVHPVAGLLD